MKTEEKIITDIKIAIALAALYCSENSFEEKQKADPKYHAHVHKPMIIYSGSITHASTASSNNNIWKN